jgi:multidrug efflux pump
MKHREFKPTSWSIDNKTSIYVITALITLFGLISYLNLPKEKFPDIVIPTIYVMTAHPGTSPADMENLITRPIEKKLKAVSGIKKITSNSVQDFSNVIVEFNTDISVEDAKQKVKDAVGKARSELPSKLIREPDVMEVDFSEMPILYVNLSGDFDLNKLKQYAEDAKDRIETLREITRVDIVGALEREIQINVDMYKMQAAKLTFGDIERAVQFENMTMSGGSIRMDEKRRSIRVVGEFKDIEVLRNVVVKSGTGAPIYLRDIASIEDSYKEKESYARLDHKNVITLNVIKKSGENLIEASDKIREVVEEMKETSFPQNLTVTLTGDQSTETRNTLHELINTIIIGFILVTIVLMFFMGVTNAIFVGLSVPLSMCLAFLVMPVLGFSMNMIVLFSFLLALGIVVDDAIVMIENTHRIFDNGRIPIVKAAKIAAGEVFLPVFSGTLTTLAPFVPLAFWGGIIGKFMFYLPVTLIVTLTASLLVAYIINPVFAVSFMKPHKNEDEPAKAKYKGLKLVAVIMVAIAAIFYINGSVGMGNFTLTLLVLFVVNKLLLTGIIKKFQEKTWPSFQARYERLITWALRRRRPYYLLLGTVGLLFLTIVITGIRKPAIVFFPTSDPNFVYVYVNMPVGTDQAVTDSVTRIVENKVYKVIGENNPIVESVISNVAVGAGDPSEGDRSIQSNKGRVSVAFVEYAHRNGESTAGYLDKIRAAVKGIPGAEIAVEQERNGPPTGKPINIEVSGEDFDQLARLSQQVKTYLDSLQIPGVEELKSDLQANKPEVLVEIDRERANREGISTGQIGNEIRTAIYGSEVSKFKEGNDDHPIQLRYAFDQRSNIDELLNLKITFRDMAMGGQIRQIPLSAVANVRYTSSYGGIKRKNLKRVITISSNVVSGYTPNEVQEKITSALKSFDMPKGYETVLTGEQEEQKETSGFLGNAMLISLGLIFLILVTQFNSMSKPVIILSEIIFSVIGVLLGFSLFNMAISIVMTGIGIVALAGIVVRNGILLVEFTDLLKEQGYKTRDAIIQAGKTRMTPVILTATATILGLVPLAIGFNIDFVTLFAELDPKIHIGGDSVAFWGPLSWTIIFGLSFATFLTLILVPAMYYISYTAKIRAKRLIGYKPVEKVNEYSAVENDIV